MPGPRTDMREAKLLQKLSDIARMKVDAEPFGNDTLEIDAPPPDDVIFLTVRAGLHEALSRCDAKIANGLRDTDFQAAATTSRHVLMAAVRSVRCVLAEVRWRCTLKVLKTAACHGVEINRRTIRAGNVHQFNASRAVKNRLSPSANRSRPFA
jgi:hypothetical protein